MTHIINPVYYQDFMLAGKARFALKSLRTGSLEPFVVKMGTGRIWWVKNRINDWIGKIIPVEGADDVYSFVIRRDLVTVFAAKQQEIFGWFWTRMAISLPVPQIEMHYDGRCAHCRRELTHPESIPIGIGPDCFKKLGLTHKPLIHAISTTGLGNGTTTPGSGNDDDSRQGL